MQMNVWNQCLPNDTKTLNHHQWFFLVWNFLTSLKRTKHSFCIVRNFSQLLASAYNWLEILWLKWLIQVKSIRKVLVRRTISQAKNWNKLFQFISLFLPLYRRECECESNPQRLEHSWTTIFSYLFYFDCTKYFVPAKACACAWA